MHASVFDPVTHLNSISYQNFQLPGPYVYPHTHKPPPPFLCFLVHHLFFPMSWFKVINMHCYESSGLSPACWPSDWMGCQRQQNEGRGLVMGYVSPTPVKNENAMASPPELVRLIYYYLIRKMKDSTSLDFLKDCLSFLISRCVRFQNSSTSEDHCIWKDCLRRLVLHCQ